MVCAVHLINRSSTKALEGKIPLETWSRALNQNQSETDKYQPDKYQPDLSYLRVFGCTAYVHIPHEKYETRSEIGHLVGYDSKNIYRIWIPETLRSREFETSYSTKELISSARKKKTAPNYLSQKVSDLLSKRKSWIISCLVSASI